MCLCFFVHLSLQCATPMLHFLPESVRVCVFNDAVRSRSKSRQWLLRPHPAVPHKSSLSLLKSKHFLSNPTQIIARTHKSEKRWSCATENKKLIATLCMKYALCWRTPTLSPCLDFTSESRHFWLVLSTALRPSCLLLGWHPCGVIHGPSVAPWQRWYCSNIPRTSGLNVNQNDSPYWSMWKHFEILKSNINLRFFPVRVKLRRWGHVSMATNHCTKMLLLCIRVLQTKSVRV